MVEGTEGSACDVYVYEKEPEGWKQVLDTPGHLGLNGMNGSRRVGDKTTPIGVFRLNTPFGQAQPLEGFPKDYIQVDSSYVWSDDTNKLEKDTQTAGEKVGTSAYEGDHWTSSSGCVAIPREQMAEIMKLYGTWDEGSCFIALAPGGTFDSIYNTYGSNHGLSPVCYHR